jgi:menaquinone-dependent protoporphyrinogen oxidase
MTRHILIVYGSRYGQTAKIASHMRGVLEHDGVIVKLLNADAIGRSFDLSGFDAVVVGSSVIGGKHRKSVAGFIKAHADTLNRVPSAFFSVSGSAASVDPRQQFEARVLMERFLVAADWNPDLMTTFGGALLYTRYFPLLRWVMKRIARKYGEPTDTTRDHEMTDWVRVDDFAHRFANIAVPETTPVVALTQHS